MRVKKFLRPVDLARAIGLSVQTVHNYEDCGFIPRVERNEKGYRLYTSQHLRAIKVARIVIAGYGWQRAQMIMHCIHTGEIAGALAVIDEHSAQIYADRREVEQTLEILRNTSTSLENVAKASEKHKQGLRIGEVANLVDVRVSAVRFWEAQGLLTPARDRGSKYRLYNDEQVRKLQVVALLRKSGYNFDAVRKVLEQLATGTPEQVRAAAEHRLQDLAEVSLRVVEATATLWQYIVEIGLSHHTTQHSSNLPHVS